MNLPNPEWYESLRGDPLNQRTFTHELAARIRWRAQTEERRGRSPLRLVLSGAVAAILLGALAMAGMQGLLPGQSDSGVREGPASPAISDVPEPMAPPASPEDPAELAYKKIMTDSEWERFLQVKDPYYDKRILIRQSLGNDKMAIYSKQADAVNTTFTDMYEWQDDHWIWFTGGFSQWHVSDPEDYKEGDDLGSVGGSFGIDHAAFDGEFKGSGSVSAIQIEDPLGVVRDAHLKVWEDGNTYWFLAYVGEVVNGTYTTRFLDAKGNVIRETPTIYTTK